MSSQRCAHVPTELFVSEDQADVSRSRSLGWDQVHRGPITIHEIPGVHLSLLTEPHVTAVAVALATSLRRAQAAATPAS